VIVRSYAVYALRNGDAQPVFTNKTVTRVPLRIDARMANTHAPATISAEQASAKTRNIVSVISIRLRCLFDTAAGS
jgi:hypothetical protein